jgi:hypothetical protein
MRGVRCEKRAGFFEGDWLYFAGGDVGHAAGDFFVPSGGDAGILGFVEAFDEGTGEVGALGDRKREGSFEEIGCFLGHGLIVPETLAVAAVKSQTRTLKKRRAVAPT